MEKKRMELVRQLMELIRTPNRFPDRRFPPERELAKSLGVSRNLLREAIITLESMGIIEIRERQGTFIAAPEAEEFAAGLKFLSFWPDDILAHLMETRLLIEPRAAGLAALRRTDEELRRMKDCVAHLESVQGDPDRGLASGAIWDSALHAIIVGAAHNPVLSRLYEGLSGTMEKYIVASRTKLLSLDAWPGSIPEEHRRIVEAIAAQDSRSAEESQRRHLQAALDKLNVLKETTDIRRV